MRYLILTDIHGNLPALEAVLRDAEKHKIDKVVSLGDIIGYYPFSNEVVSLIRQNADISVPGNHDQRALDIAWIPEAERGKVVNGFNPLAKEAILDVVKNLNNRSMDYLESILEAGDHVKENDLVFSHSMPLHFEPKNMAYIQSYEDAAFWFFAQKHYLESMLGTSNIKSFIGHTHKPQFYFIKNSSQGEKEVKFSPDLEERNVIWRKLGDYDSSIIVGPGLGQPRDGCKLTGYMIYDTDTDIVKFVRLPYDIAKVQRKLERTNLEPGTKQILGGRLNMGV